MADPFLLLDGAARTLLQSFDTARYQKVEDGSQAPSEEDRLRARVNRQLDTAHARTEVLSAMLMGYEIVVPAGVLADCVAFADVFGEVTAGREASGVSTDYRPFRIGLEKQFEATEGPTGYDRYLVDFADNYREGLVQLGAAEGFKPAEETLKTKTQNIRFLVNAFRNRDFTMLDKAQGGLGGHMQRVHEQLGDFTGAPPVIALNNPFSGMMPGHFLNEFDELAANIAKRKGVDQGRVAALLASAKEVEGLIPSANQRGQWYKRKDVFGKEWQEARCWLDYVLYDVMTSAYGVSVPSLFGQQTHDDSHTNGVALAHLDEPTYTQFRADWSDQEAGSPPVADEVVWTDIWKLVADDKFAASARKMQGRLAEAYNVERSKVYSAQGMKEKGDLSAGQAAEQVSKAHADRDTKVKEALEEHIGFMNANATGLLFVRTPDGIRIDSGARPVIIGERAAKAAEAVAAIGLIPALTMFYGMQDEDLSIAGVAKGVVKGGSALLTLKMADKWIGNFVDDRVKRSVRAVVEKVNRAATATVPETERHALQTAMRDQVNLWIKPKFTGL